MKRLRYLLLILCALFMLSACSAGGEYTYDSVRGVDYFGHRASNWQYKLFTGGSIRTVFKDEFYGTDRDLSAGNNRFCVMFNEETGLLYPLCFDLTCTHEDQDSCFALKTANPFDRVFVLQDRIFIIDSKEIIVYSFDGIVETVYEYPLDELVCRDGSVGDIAAPSPDIDSVFFRDDTLYLIFYGYSQIDFIEEGVLYNHWILSFSFDKREFTVLCNYTVPDPYAPSGSDVAEFNGENLSILHDNRIIYNFDLSDGSYTVEDYTYMVDAVAEKYGLEPMFFGCDVLPLSRIIYVSDYPNQFFVDMDSFEETSVDPLEYISAYPGSDYLIYKGEKYFIDNSSDNDGGSLHFLRESNGKKLAVSKSFADGKYNVGFSPYFESENGVIFKFFPAGITEYENRYEVKEGDKVTQFQKAPGMIYVTKDDLFDGTIDDPAYYDPETGLFS
ncbi:MAG: hypothetical protein IJY86_03195 [Clostridia bacterium]|nr:hypothetical protein [Clostridia bacterium]